MRQSGGVPEQLDEEITMYVIDAPTTFAPAFDADDVDNDAADTETAPKLLEDPALVQRSGTGAWPNGDRAVRTGSCEEVLITVAGDRLNRLGDSDPNELFAPRLKRLDVDLSSLRRAEHELAWDVRVRTLPGRRRRASMRVYSSPSGNVTVLTLVPATTSKVFPTAFIRAGLRSMRQVGTRLETLTP